MSTTADDERYGDDLAAQYRLARTEYPDADAHRLIEVIVSRLGHDAVRYYAADPDRMPAIAVFVHELERDPGEDDDDNDDVEP